MQLEQRGRLQKSVAKEVSGQGTLMCLGGNSGSHLGWWADGPTEDSGCGVFGLEHVGIFAESGKDLVLVALGPAFLLGGVVGKDGVCVEGCLPAPSCSDPAPT